MGGEREAATDAAPAGDGSTSASVQQAVEQFVELHSCGRAPDPATFAARYPEALRARILTQCREFLAFDGLMGHQEWQPSPAKDTPGRTFGDFVIQEELGRGGMGVVYLAHQKSLNRRVALKVMASGLTLSKRHVERFRREAAAAAQLCHPAIVAVHSLTEVDGTFALAMDFIAGRNLADILDDLRLSNGEGPAVIEGSLGLAPEKGHVAECAMFVAQLASALAAAHQANVVHRDLKPRNLMLDDRRQVRLLDFGLAKSLGEGSISMSGEITGTAHYMSPEQTLAKRVTVDHRTDIWALGVILYEMLTLRRPFDGKNLQQIVYEICFKEPPPPQRLNHKVPRDLATICQKALEKDPNKRYPTAAELEADLQRFLRWEPVHAKPAGTMSRLLKWTRRHRTETAIAGVLALGGIALLVSHWHQGRQADQLLALAGTAESEGRFDDASALATKALALRNDEATRARLKSYGDASLRHEAQATNKALQSKDLIKKDRELATIVALAAEAQHSSLVTRSAVLDALGSSVPRALRAADPAGKFIGARWSPDGQRAITLGYGVVTVWHAANATAVATLRGHTGEMPVLGAAFLDAEQVVTVGADKTMRFWRLGEEAPTRTLPLPGQAAGLRIDRDGKRVLVLTYGGREGPFLAQVHDTATGQPCSPAVAHTEYFVASALSPCGRFAATCSGMNGNVRLWRVDDGQPVQPAALAPRGRVRAVAFSPDSSVLAAAIEHGVHLIRVADGAPLGTAFHAREVMAIAFDSKGERLLSGARDWTARLWRLERDAATGAIRPAEVATLVDHDGPVHHVAFDATDQLALTATGGDAGALCVFDVGADRAPTGTAVQRTEVGPSIESAEFSPDGRSVLAVAGQSRALIWAFGTTRGVVTMRQPAWATATAFDATGLRLVTAGDDERLRLWSARDGNLLWESKKLGNPLRCVDVDAPGERIASATNDGTVRLHRLSDGEVLCTLAGHREVVHVARFQRAGSRLLTAGRDTGQTGLAIVWNTNDQSRVCELTRSRPIVGADLAPDGNSLATVEDGDTTVRIWSVPDGALLAELKGHTQRVASVTFAPNGATVLTAGRDRSARIFALDGTQQQAFRADQPLKFATFSRGGDLVLTGSEGSDAKALLWRVADGAEWLSFRGHRGSFEHGAFSPDGAWVATAARDGTTCLWPTDPVAAARRLPLRPLSDAERREYGLAATDPPPK